MAVHKHSLVTEIFRFRWSFMPSPGLLQQNQHYLPKSVSILKDVCTQLTAESSVSLYLPLPYAQISLLRQALSTARDAVNLSCHHVLHSSLSSMRHDDPIYAVIIVFTWQGPMVGKSLVLTHGTIGILTLALPTLNSCMYLTLGETNVCNE